MIVFGQLLALGLVATLFTLARMQLAGAPGGDGGVGYAWAMMIGHAAVLALLLALTAVVGLSGRLPATYLGWSQRLVPALLFVGVSSGLAAMVAMESPTGGVHPLSVRAAIRLAPLLVPFFLTLTGALLLSAPSLREALVAWPTRLLSLVLIGSVASTVVLLAPNAIRWIDVQRQLASRDPDALDSFQQQVLDGVNAADPSRQFASLLEATRDGNHRTIRERALTRIHEVPDWEDRLRSELSDGNAHAAFTYLASADVSTPRTFLDAAIAGVSAEAERVRTRMGNASHSSHLYEGLMARDVDAILRSLSKLPADDTRLHAALRDLRAAFAEPTPWPHPPYRAVAEIDQWLRRHS